MSKFARGTNKMAFRKALNWFKKASQATATGAVVGGSTVALSATIGDALTRSLHKQDHSISDAALTAGFGGMVLYAGLGFLESTPLSTSKILSKIGEFDSSCGVLAPFVFAGTQSLSGVLGYEMLKTLIQSLPLETVAADALIGSPFTLMTLLLIMCIAKNKDAIFDCGQKRREASVAEVRDVLETVIDIHHGQDKPSIEDDDKDIEPISSRFLM